MLKVLIVEDEFPAAKRLIRLLEQVDPTIEVLDTLDSVERAVAWLKQHQADLIFLDIHLADGNSFSIFEQVTVKTPIIFATAYDKYAIQAFKLNSVDYLLKPIEREELAQSLAKYRDTRQTQAPLDVEALLRAMQPQHEYQKRFMVTAGDKIKSVPIEEVAYFFGQQKYVFLTTKDNRQYIVDFTLGKLEDMLDPQRFFRINRQFIISFDAIASMFAYSKSRVKIELDPPGEIEAIVSIEKAPRFKEWLNR
jgi:DNA-binding LytR/AlgR family response regulator